MAQKLKTPTAEPRKLVETMAAVGIPAEIDMLGDRRLRQNAAQALSQRARPGGDQGQAEVAGFLFNSAKKGNVTAQIFWLKTRAGWKEPAVDHNHRGAIGTYDLTKLSNEKLAELEAILGSAALAGGDQGRESPTAG